MLRYYTGLSVAETADVLDVDTKTVTATWKYAQAWLSRELKHLKEDLVEG